MRIYTFICLILYSTILNALNTDGKEPLYITSHSASLDYQHYTVLYQGQVKVKQGSTSLYADKLILYFNNKHQITQIIAYGNPVVYTTLTHIKEKPLEAKAEQIEYLPLSNKVILRDHAQVKKDQTQLQSEIIEYNTLTSDLYTFNPHQEDTTFIFKP